MLCTSRFSMSKPLSLVCLLKVIAEKIILQNLFRESQFWFVKHWRLIHVVPSIEIFTKGFKNILWIETSPDFSYSFLKKIWPDRLARPTVANKEIIFSIKFIRVLHKISLFAIFTVSCLKLHKRLIQEVAVILSDVRIWYHHHLSLTGIKSLIHNFEANIRKSCRVPCEILKFISGLK